MQCTVFRQILTHTRTHFHPSDYEIFRLLTYYALSIDLRACIPFGFSLSMAILIARTHSAAHINYKTVLWGFFLFAFFLFLSWPGLAWRCFHILLFHSLSLIVRRIFHPLKFFLIFFMAKGHAIRPYFHYFHFSFPLRSFRSALVSCHFHTIVFFASASARSHACMHAHFTEFNNKNHNITMMCAAKKIVCVLSAGIDECILITNGDVIIIIICLYQFF